MKSYLAWALLSVWISAVGPSPTNALLATTSVIGGSESTYQRERSDDGPQSVECSSAEECRKLGEQYLVKRLGARLAVAALKKSITLDPNNAEAQKALASAYMRDNTAINIGHMSEDEYNLAETACRTAISLNPDDPDAFLLLGQILDGEVYLGFRTDNGAVLALSKAVELRPEWPEAYCELGHAHKLLNQYEEAAAAYESEAVLQREKDALRKERDSATLEFQKQHEARDAVVLAQIYASLGKYNKTLTWLRHAAGIKPEDEIIRSSLIRAYLQVGDVESARREHDNLSALCRSKDRFFVTQCERSAQELLDAIKQKSRQ